MFIIFIINEFYEKSIFHEIIRLPKTVPQKGKCPAGPVLYIVEVAKINLENHMDKWENLYLEIFSDADCESEIRFPKFTIDHSTW